VDDSYTTTRLATRRRTSDSAYASASLSPTRSAILGMLRDEAQTCDDLMERHGLEHQSASAAINWLMRHGFVRDSGFRRLTRSGRMAIVWEAALIPIPIHQTRPTRSELERRIQDAIALIAAGAESQEILKALDPNRR
jgi:DNA-binding transcriptional ArsR family regulator